jgi:hypothetical protein
VQVTRLGCRGRGHGSEQGRCRNELLASAWSHVRVVDVKVGEMRSRVCLPSSCARSPRAKASPAMVARRSRTC